ncbi:MAG: hypothetical protein AAF823_14060 [Planctomycetota bacterium]
MAVRASTAALSDVVAGLFVEPLHGFNRAQMDIVDHWIATLERLKQVLGQGGANKPKDPAALIAATLAMAPKWSATIRGDASIVLRVASLTQTQGQVSLGVAVGPFQASGSFGFMSETASESVIQARASYVVSDDGGEISLRDLLKLMNVPEVAGPKEVETAVGLLGDLKTALTQPVKPATS